ncbi:MAG: family 10 glycosylhydrolase [Calditrichae bacterium]|nr:family 10 glycosylhydrolase [Calditrichia bacterium]
MFKRVVKNLFVILVVPALLLSAEKELRGVWFAWAGADVPSKEYIADTMDKLAAANFNVVYVDVWRFGFPYYQSEYFSDITGIWTDPSLVSGRDVLAEMIAEGHRAGLEVDAWFESGFAATSDENNDLFYIYPEWFAQKKDGSYDFYSNGGILYNWLSHCNKEAQQFLIRMATEVARNYDVDGIEFDRVRYPQLDCGYDPATVELYQDEHDGQSPPSNTSDAGWMRWRADKLTEFVSELYDSIKAVNPAITVSNAPLPWGYEQFCQDWPPWVNNNYLDIVSTQMYYTDNATYTWRLNRELGFITNNSKMYPGISTVADVNATPPSELVKMINTTRSKGLKGQVIWYTRNLLENPDYFAALTENVYAEKAELPYRPDNYRVPAVIVNETDADVQKSDGWKSYDGVSGFQDASLYTSGSSGQWIEFSADLPKTGWYEVYAYIIRHWNGHKNAAYQIYSNGGTDTVFIDQSKEANARWTKLGDFYMESGSHKRIRLTDQGIGSYLLFADAVMFLETKRVMPNVSAIHEKAVDAPVSFELKPAYPNPFNPETTISFSLPQNGTVKLEIFNVRGERIVKLADAFYQAGTHLIKWNAAGYPSGVYYYTINFNHSRKTAKLVLIK